MYAMFNGQPVFGSCTADIYSTEETRIGTWIDGKPIYRRAFSAKAPSTDTVASIAQIEPGVDLIRLEYIATDKGDGSFSGNYYGTVKDRIALWFERDTGNIMCTINGEKYHSAPIKLIVEYTKTTDTASTLSSLSTQNLSVDSFDPSSPSSEKILSANASLPSLPSSVVSTSISFSPASAASSELEL